MVCESVYRTYHECYKETLPIERDEASYFWSRRYRSSRRRCRTGEEVTRTEQCRPNKKTVAKFWIAECLRTCYVVHITLSDYRIRSSKQQSLVLPRPRCLAEHHPKSPLALIHTAIGTTSLLMSGDNKIDRGSDTKGSAVTMPQSGFTALEMLTP